VKTAHGAYPTISHQAKAAVKGRGSVARGAEMAKKQDAWPV